MTLKGGGCDFFDFKKYFLDFGFSQELFQLFKNNVKGIFDKNSPTYICTTTYLSYISHMLRHFSRKLQVSKYVVVICDLDCKVLAWTGKIIEIL